MTEEKNKKFDTSEVLTEDDYREIEDIKEIRKRLLAYINIEVLIEKIREIIDESDYVSFKNERSKKFIDKRRPIFYITIDKSKIFKSDEYKHSKTFSSADKEASYYSNIVYKEVINKTTTFINDSLKNSKDNETEELKEYIMSTSLFKDDLPKDDESFYSRMSILSMMFGMRLENDNKNNIALEMLI